MTKTMTEALRKLEFQDQVVMITGATGGVGQATASLFAAAGAKLILLGTDEARLEETRQKLGSCGETLLLALDIAEEAAVRQAVAAAVERFGTVDVLVNTAGISGPAALTEDYSFADFRRVYEVNVFGVFLTMKYVLPLMKRQGRGAIVNTASISGTGGYALEVGYGSSKFAVIGLTKDVASECPHNGVRVNCISPGWIDTKMMTEIMANYQRIGELEDAADFDPGPMGRAGTPLEMAQAIYFLASERASYINGANFVIDGGATIG